TCAQSGAHRLDPLALHDALPMSADRPGALTFSSRFERKKGMYMDQAYRHGSDTIVMTNECGGKDGITYSAALKASQTGGTVKARSESTRLNSSHVKISYAVFCLQ